MAETKERKTISSVEREAEWLAAISHRRGCPQKRVEAYSEVQIERRDGDVFHRPVTILRCLECGEFSITDRQEV